VSKDKTGRSQAPRAHQVQADHTGRYDRENCDDPQVENAHALHHLPRLIHDEQDACVNGLVL
jgi:hypothetical protein